MGSPEVYGRTDSVLCVECGDPITGRLLWFGGSSACESCVRAYYERQGCDRDTIALEITERARLALAQRPCLPAGERVR